MCDEAGILQATTVEIFPLGMLTSVTPFIVRSQFVEALSDNGMEVPELSASSTSVVDNQIADTDKKPEIAATASTHASVASIESAIDANQVRTLLTGIRSPNASISEKNDRLGKLRALFGLNQFEEMKSVESRHQTLMGKKQMLELWARLAMVPGVTESDLSPDMKVGLERARAHSVSPKKKGKK